MGKIPNGILGNVIGSIGNVTAYMLNGQNVTRIKARKISHFSENQLANQQGMTVINEFFYFMGAFLKAGFSLAAKGTTKNYHNLATSYNKKNALKGVYPNIEMDYTKALLSTGDLPEAQNPIAEPVAEGLKFSWDLPEVNSLSGEDQVMILAYGTISRQVQYILYGQKRTAGEAILQLSPKMRQEPVETYISFVSPDRQEVSDSIYVGRIEPIVQTPEVEKKTTKKSLLLLTIVSPAITIVQTKQLVKSPVKRPETKMSGINKRKSGYRNKKLDRFLVK